MIDVRVARRDEHDAVADLTARVYLAEGFASEEYEAALRDVGSRAATATVLVAVDGDQVIGAVTVATRLGPWAEQASPGEAVVRMLVVDPERRGEGVGHALVRETLARARADGCSLVRLSSEPEMTAAHRLYRRLGFVRVPSFDWSPSAGISLLAFALTLQPWCGQCGQELAPEGHERCRASARFDPPRYCGACRRRMVVQVTPTEWTARCVEHGQRSGRPG